MTDFNIDDFQTFDIQKRRQELANPPVSQAVLDARTKTAQMANDYNRLNQFVALATGRRAGAPMEVPTYSDAPTTAQTTAADEQAASEFMRSLEKMQEQLGRPIKQSEIPAIANAYGLGTKGLAIVDKYFKYIGRTEEQERAARAEERAEIKFGQDQEKAASEDRVNASVFGVMSNHRADIVGSSSETVVNRIEEAVADIYADESLSEQEKLDAAAKVYERSSKVADLNKSQRQELRTIEDREVAARNRALSSGRTIIRNQLVEEGIDRIKAGEDFQTVKEDIMLRANRDIMDKDIIASVRSGLEFARKPDTRSTASKNFDEVMALLGPSDNRAFNINKVIQMEVDSANTNPLFYEYTMPRKEAQAIEQAFYKLKMADPDVIDEQAFRQEFNEFAETATNEQVEAALQRAEQQLGIPKRMLLYIAYGRKGYQDLVEGN
tara:strand:- start:3035 stop:4348 length:1314 start_codon:yes stop_codon:yes gene_type:complete